jgi:hypothetical protein
VLPAKHPSGTIARDEDREIDLNEEHEKKAVASIRRNRDPDSKITEVMLKQ